MSFHAILAWGLPMGAEWIVIAALGLLLFGKRLPEVGRSLGQGIVQFKKGLKGVEEDIEQVDDAQPSKTLPDTSNIPTAPAAKGEYKFDPYTGKPVEPLAPKFDPYTG